MKDFSMRDFEKSVNILFDKLEDAANEMFKSDNIIEYFSEAYDYEEGRDIPVFMLIEYINRNYNL